MRYSVELKKRAKKFIISQPPTQQRRIMKAIGNLPALGDIRQVKGLENVYGLRIGNYRIVYELHESDFTIIVIDINMRGQVYKNLKLRL